MTRRRLERREYLLLRFAAVLIDALFFSLALIIPGTVVSVAALMSGAEPPTIRTIWWATAGVLIFSMVVRDGYRGRSPGKRVLGLLVQTPNEPCGVFRSIVRNSTLFLLPLAPIEVLFVLVGSESRRIGDLLARTTIVEE